MSIETLRRTDETPCLLFPELVAQGGGLQRSVQERASLYARRWERVLLLTTGFTPNWHRVPMELKERGSLDPRVTVRNLFAHSTWMAQLGVPPQEAYAVEDGVEARPQRLRGREPFRLADVRAGERYPFRYRYFDHDGRTFLTTYPGGGTKHEQNGVDAAGARSTGRGSSRPGSTRRSPTCRARCCSRSSGAATTPSCWRRRRRTGRSRRCTTATTGTPTTGPAGCGPASGSSSSAPTRSTRSSARPSSS